MKFTELNPNISKSILIFHVMNFTIKCYKIQTLQTPTLIIFTILVEINFSYPSGEQGFPKCFISKHGWKSSWLRPKSFQWVIWILGGQSTFNQKTSSSSGATIGYTFKRQSNASVSSSLILLQLLASCSAIAKLLLSYCLDYGELVESSPSARREPRLLRSFTISQFVIL